jgi:iron(III) transport system substrate-binding protein
MSFITLLRLLIISTSLLIFSSCQSDKNSSSSALQEQAKKEIWIYTSMYKDTIADITPQLKKDFPELTFYWFQAGSEDMASKVNAEMLAGGTKADLLISSDRFWYEEMAKMGKLHNYQSPLGMTMDTQLRHPNNMYFTLSIPVMVMAYNNESMTAKEAPKSFKEMSKVKWKGKFTTGSPLASGTNFTTMAMLQAHYGWDYFKKLKENKTIAQGGNSAVLRRIQSKERPIGWVLLENLLRFKNKDQRLEIIYPTDGTIIHGNIMAITKKSGSRAHVEEVVEWLFSSKGQQAMTRSYMYSPMKNIAAPVGAPDFSTILKNSFPWTQKFINAVTENRAELKETYTEIMFE